MEVAYNKSGEAMYRPGFLCIDLPFKVRELSEYSIEELGTYLHEYVHFLQNLTTPWGLYETSCLYTQIQYCFNQVSEDKEPILYLPVEKKYSDDEKYSDRINEIIKSGRGSDKAKCSDKTNIGDISVYSIQFSDNTDFNIEKRKNRKINNISEIWLHFNTCNHSRRAILFGAWAIKESMAALIQKKLDPSSPNRHADVPYSLIQCLAKDCFPNIADNEDMLIALCYYSLFSMSPAILFIEMADYANENSKLGWKEILKKYWDKEIRVNGRCCKVEDFYKDMSIRFLTLIGGLLRGVDLVYILKMIRATQFTFDTSPILRLIKDSVDINDIKEIHSISGEPVVMGNDNSGSFPYLVDSNNTVNEIIYLLGFETLFKFLTTNPPTCPRYENCIIVNKVESSCCTTPWTRKDDCILKEVALYIGIKKDKHVIRK